MPPTEHEVAPVSAIETRFEVQSVTALKGKTEQVKLGAVQHSSTKPENKVFSQYTPFGLIDFTITNPNALGLFEPGDEFRVTFEKISSAEA